MDSGEESSSSEECETKRRPRSAKQKHLLESLNAVTTHFAHVQFRLKQIIDAPLEDKEALLKELEEFAFKGVPETQVSDCRPETIETLKRQVAELKASIRELQSSPVVSAPRPPDIVDRVLSVVQMMNVHRREEYIPRSDTRKCNHWGDVRAQLEVTVGKVAELALQPDPVDSDYMSDSEGVSCDRRLAAAVRKQLAPALQRLMQHGLAPQDVNSISVHSLTMALGCMPRAATGHTSDAAHAWDLVLKYYKLKHGDEFNSSPALKLSQSFNLHMETGTSSTQRFLIAVGNIIATHAPYKRSNNTQFKAFVCAGLNAKMLATWLLSMYRCQALVEAYYERWSYARKTGFEDACKSLQQLNRYHFHLPVDVAVHQLQNIKDAF